MQKQREAVERAFEEWRGNDGQIDDVLVVGIKLTIEKQAIFEPSKYNWKDKVILIAEDLELNYILLVNALEKTRIEIIRAKDGIEALEISKSNPRINLVLMDIDMPRMDGYEATRQIKRMRPKLPIIAQTALSMIDEKEKSAEAGCDDYIAKPIKLQSFLNTLSKFLDK
jgi:CheY-like chemotaxis protein